MKKGVKQARKRTHAARPEGGRPMPERTAAGVVRRPWSWIQALCLLLVLLPGAYVAIRAVRLELAGEEARFWQEVLNPGLEPMLTLEQLDPRNHFLPGLLSLPFLKLWKGNPVTGIRMPDVLAFFLFAWAGWRLGRRLEHGWLRVVVLLGWFGNAVLLDAFGQAQGYGLMVAFASLACLGVVETYDRRHGPARQEPWGYLAILAAAAAVLAVMGFAAGFCAIAGLLVLRHGLDAGTSPSPDAATAESGSEGWRRCLAAAWERSGFVFATVLAVGVFYLPRYLILQDHPAMQGWGGTGFLHDTLASALDTVPHAPPHALSPHLPMIAGAVAGLMALNALAAAASLRRRKNASGVRGFLESPTVLLTVLVAGIWLLSGLAHAVAQVPYPVRPTSLFLWPLVVAQGVFAMDEAAGIWKWGIRALNLAALAVALAVAGREINLDHGASNEAMARQSEIAREIAKMAREARGRPVVVGLSDPMKHSFGYYMETAGGLKESPQTARNPVFRMFGNNVYIYSLNYELPDGAPWHWHPATTHYLLSEFSGHRPEPTLMETNPLAYWQGMRAGLYRALPQEKSRGCDPGTCGICNYFRAMTE